MDDCRSAFREFAGWAADTSPLYERCCHIVVNDPDLLDLAATVPAERARANVFLAAVHRLVREGPDHPLAEYFPGVATAPRAPDESVDGRSLADLLRSFCLEGAADLRPLLAERRTQTNAVRRSAVLYPAFAHLAARTDGPLALVEVGPSAGLNLLWDRYGYTYDRGDERRRVGAGDASVTIESTVEAGDPPLPDDPPTVHSRIGIDLHPLDVTDPDDRAWLRALTWPEHVGRRALLDDAMALAQGDPPDLIEGDAVDALPSVLDAIPADVPVVVYSTLVLYQVPDEVRARLRDLLADRASERPLHWLTGSSGHDDPGDGIDLTWHRFDADPERLATFQPHGEWLAWHGT